jgi:hypothetical protein
MLMLMLEHVVNEVVTVFSGFILTPIMNFQLTVLTLSDPMSDFFRYYDFPVPEAFPHVVRTLADR